MVGELAREQSLTVVAILWKPAFMDLSIMLTNGL